MSAGGSFLCFLPLWRLAPSFKKVGKIRTFLIRRDKNRTAVSFSEKMMPEIKKMVPKKPMDLVRSEAP